MKVENLKDLGEQIRARRKEARLSIDDTAELLGVGRRLLIELEHGNRRASVDTVLKTLKALGLELHVEGKQLGTNVHLPLWPEVPLTAKALRGSSKGRPRLTSRKKKTRK